MANCGCKPCSKPLPKKTKVCKSFSICVGNKTLIWDGDCATVQDRQYQIPNGTYTSITFENGCIVAVGQATIPQYTPQQCCDTGTSTISPSNTNNLSASKTRGNLVSIQNGVLTVTPLWDNANGIIKVDGYGTADQPWKMGLKLSKAAGNILKENTDGLFANVFFKDSETVKVAGKGTPQDPYLFTTKSSSQGSSSLNDLNEEEYGKQGITIREDGRVEVSKGFELTSNLSFSSDAFTVDNNFMGTSVKVDLQKLMVALEPYLRALGYCKCNEKPVTNNVPSNSGGSNTGNGSNTGGGLSEASEVNGNSGSGDTTPPAPPAPPAPTRNPVQEWVAQYRVTDYERRSRDDVTYVSYETREILKIDGVATDQIRNYRSYHRVSATSTHRRTDWIDGVFNP